MSTRKPSGFDSCGIVENHSAEKPPLWFVVTRSLSYYSAKYRRTFTVPEGFGSDGRSSPRFLWALVPPVGICLEPALLHDFLYKTALVSRAKADAIFREALVSAGLAKWKAWVNWAGLRLGGWIAWGEHRRRDRQQLRLPLQ